MWLHEEFKINVTSPVESQQCGVLRVKDKGTRTYSRDVGVTLLRTDAEGMVASHSLPPHKVNKDMVTHSHVAGHADPKTGELSMPEWFKAKTVAEVEQKMRVGDPVYTERVEKMSKQLLEPMPVDARRKITYSDDGDELDENRWLDLDFDHMWRRTVKTMRRTTNKVIDVGFMWGGAAVLKEEQLAAAGAAAVALVNRLEELGYSCGIRMFFVQTGGTGSNRDHNRPDNVCVGEVSLKHPGEPLNIGAISFLASHPAVFRFYGIGMFRFEHFEPGWGMGRMISEQVPQEAERIINELAERRMLEPCTIMLPVMNSFTEAHEAVQAVLTSLDDIETSFLND